MSSDLQAAIAKFSDYLRNEKRYSPATIANYTRSLNQLGAQLQVLHIARWRDVQTDQIQSFIAKSHRGGLSPGSLRDMLFAGFQASGESGGRSRRRMVTADCP